MTQPIKEVIPREVPENIVPTLNLFSSTIEEVINFGSHILMWDTSPKTNGEENIAPTMLFRHFLDLIDSISILVKHSCGDTSKLLIRGALEVLLAMEYLFEKDTHDRAMAFIVADVLNQIKTIKKLNPETKEGTELYKTFEQEDTLKNYNLNDKFDLKDILANKERVLRLPQFQKAFKEFERLKKQGESNPKWYRYFNGPKNIESLAKHLKKKTFYELLYRKWSGSVHGSDIYLGKLTNNNNDGVDIVQLRYVKDVQEVTQYSITLSLMVFQLFVDNRIPEKKVTMSQWYMSIRDRYFLINGKKLIIVED